MNSADPSPLASEASARVLDLLASAPLTAVTAARRRLPKRRSQVSWKLGMGGHSLHVTVGHYADGRPGEVFVEMHREGTALRVFSAAFAIVLSIALQHGVPLATLVQALLGLAGEPSGDVIGDAGVRRATSIPDLIARLLAVNYLDRADLAEPKGGAL